MKLFSVRQARDSLYKLIDKVAEHHEPIIIHGKRNNAVLISQEDWDAIAETLCLNNIPGMVDSIQEASREAIEDGTELEDLEW